MICGRKCWYYWVFLAFSSAYRKLVLLVIGHDQHDIWLLGFGRASCQSRERGENSQSKLKTRTHEKPLSVEGQWGDRIEKSRFTLRVQFAGVNSLAGVGIRLSNREE